MEESEASRTLVNRTISKLLDFENVPAPKANDSPELLELTTPEHSNDTYTLTKTAGGTPLQMNRLSRRVADTVGPQEIGTLEQPVQTNKNQIFVVVAWILLLLIAWVVVGNKIELPLGLEVIEETYGNLFYICMLVLAGCVLSLTTWLYWKNKLTKTANVGVVIVIILSVSLPILTMESVGGNTNIGRLTRTLSGFPLTPTASFYEPINGIIYSEEKPSAIIGGRIVHEGDTHYGVKIVKIHKDKIEFEENGKRWTQHL